MKRTHQILKPSLSLWAVALGLACMSHAAVAAPDAGTLLKQYDPDKQALPPPLKKLPSTAQPGEAREGEAKVWVNRFAFNGNKLLSEEKLQAALALFQNQNLTFSQLQQAAQAVMTFYRAQGWIASAYLPRQEIENGVVSIQIVEAVFGGVAVEGSPSQKVSANRLVRMTQAANVKGQALSAANLDRALLLMDELPGVAVVGNLVPGQSPGETNLVLSVLDQATLVGRITTDNAGSKTTGANRLQIYLQANSPLGWGDQLDVNALKTQGSDFGRLALSVPVGYDGLRAGLHTSRLQYQLLSGFSELDASGTATAAGLDIAYPLLRSQGPNASFNLSIDHKKFVNVANGAATSDYNIQVASAGLSANRFDAFAGGGSSSASVTLTGGRVDLQNSPNQFADTAGPNTAGNFKKLNVSISRLQAITSGTTLLLQASGQATHKNLDSSEKIYLGGAASVRAYPSSEVGGVAGRTFTVELRQQLWNALSLTGFYDWGRIQVNHTPFGASTVNDLGLQGRGFSLAWQPSANIDLKASVARRNGSNPSANPLTGLDTDGSFKLNRVWLNASIAL